CGMTVGPLSPGRTPMGSTRRTPAASGTGRRAAVRKGSPVRLWTTLVAVVALGAATACSTKDSAGASPSDARTARPKPSVDAEAIAAAEKAALAAYAGYLEASQKAELARDPMHPELTKYLADPLL